MSDQIYSLTALKIRNFLNSIYIRCDAASAVDGDDFQVRNQRLGDEVCQGRDRVRVPRHRPVPGPDFVDPVVRMIRQRPLKVVVVTELQKCWY